jgi:hypothetical protein
VPNAKENEYRRPPFAREPLSRSKAGKGLRVGFFVTRGIARAALRRVFLCRIATYRLPCCMCLYLCQFTARGFRILRSREGERARQILLRCSAGAAAPALATSANDFSLSGSARYSLRRARFRRAASAGGISSRERVFREFPDCRECHFDATFVNDEWAELLDKRDYAHLGDSWAVFYLAFDVLLCVFDDVQFSRREIVFKRHTRPVFRLRGQADRRGSLSRGVSRACFFIPRIFIA